MRSRVVVAAGVAAVVGLTVGWRTVTSTAPDAASELGLAPGDVAGELRWRARRPLPVQRSEVAAARLGAEVVVVGGFIQTGQNTARVDAYDTRRNRWRRLPDLPVAVDHAAAASDGQT